MAQAFTQRRKAIRNGLKSWVSAEQFQAVGIDAGLRPDQLSVADYVALANISRPPADVEDANAPHTEQGKGDNSQ